MFVYRLASRKYPPNNSEGARTYGGRWNMAGTPAIYASTTRSLAALEVIIHNGAIPWDYQVIEIGIPDDVAIKEMDLKLLHDWPDGSTQHATARYGTQWAQSLGTAVLRAPSAAIRSEFNYVLNPLHPDFARITFGVPATEEIDPRLRAAAIPPAIIG